MHYKIKQLVLLFALFPLVSFGQSADSTRVKWFGIGFNFSPDYSYRILKPTTQSKWIADLRDTLEIPKFGYTTGLNLLFRVSRNITLETGLQYSNKGEKTKTYPLLFINPNSPQEPTVTQDVSFVYSYNYLDIPIKANFFLINKKFKLFLSGGISNNLLLFSTSKSTITFSPGNSSTSTVITSTKYSTVNMAVLAGFGIEHHLNSRCSLRLEPIYRRSLRSIIDAPIESYLYSVGMNFGLYFSL